MVKQVKALIAGKPIDCPVYDYALHNRSAETLRIEPAPVLIVEGILIFAEPEIRDLIDIKLYVDTDADVRILRRIKRDVVERGRTLESVEKQYLETVKPMHELYVEPSKAHADLIIPEGGIILSRSICSSTASTANCPNPQPRYSTRRGAQSSGSMG